MDSLKSKNITITTSLFDYFPNKLNTGIFNLEAELYLKNKKSIAVNVGFIRSYGPSGSWLQISSLYTQGMKIQVEGKFYLNKRKIFQPAILLFWPHIFQYQTKELENTGYYMATNVVYQNTKTDRQETIIDNIDNNPFPNSYHYKKNNYTVNRNVYGLNVKIGYQCIKRYRLTVDYAVGLGIQYISSNSKNRVGTDQSWPNSENDFPWKKLFDNGASIVPNFIYQLKLGWAF